MPGSWGGIYFVAKRKRGESQWFIVMKYIMTNTPCMMRELEGGGKIDPNFAVKRKGENFLSTASSIRLDLGVIMLKVNGGHIM